MNRFLPGALQVCRHLEKEGGWQNLAGCSATEAAARLERDVATVIESDALQIPKRPAGDRFFQPDLASIDLAILYFFEIALLCLDRSDTEGLFWPEVESRRGTATLQNLATNLGNNLLGVRTLSLRGLAAEARLVARGFVETADLAVATAVDRDFYLLYVNADQDSDRSADYWRKHLTPARCRKTLSAFEAKLGANDELRTTLQSWREDMYRWLSRFAHVHPVGSLINAYAIHGDNILVSPAFGGVRDARSRTTLRKTASYAWLTVRQLGMALASTDHGWYALSTKNDHDRSWVAYHWEFMNRYFLKSRQSQAWRDSDSP